MKLKGIIYFGFLLAVSMAGVSPTYQSDLNTEFGNGVMSSPPYNVSSFLDDHLAVGSVDLASGWTLSSAKAETLLLTAYDTPEIMLVFTPTTVYLGNRITVDIALNKAIASWTTSLPTGAQSVQSLYKDRHLNVSFIPSSPLSTPTMSATFTDIRGSNVSNNILLSFQTLFPSININYPAVVSLNEGGLLVISPSVEASYNSQFSVSLAGWVTTKNYNTTYVDAGTHDVYIIADDIYGNRVTKTVTIVVADVSSLVLTSTGIKLISLPIGHVVTADNWTYFGWNQANNMGMGGYTTTDVNTIGLGQAVWVKATTDIVIDLTTGNQTIADRQINLVRGWNLVANPHMTQYDVSKSMVVSYNGQTYSLMAAVSANLIHNAAYGWDGTQFVSADVLLNPFEGVFIGAIRPVTLLLPTRDGVVTVMHMASVAASGRELVLQVQALQEGNTVGQVKLVANDARAVFTDAMVPPPSPMGSNIGLYAVKEGTQLLTMQQPMQDSMQWPITLVSSAAGNVTLKVTDVLNTQAIPYQLSVVDAQTNIVTPIKDGQVTIYQNAGMSQYVIKAINIFTAAGFSTLKVYPNPFSPANGNATIAYNATGVGGTATAKLAIYTIHGRKVLDKTYSGNANPGTVPWDGRDDNGVLMPSGLYFYMLDLTDGSANNAKAKGKIVLWQ